jgi:hypothetical protein
MMLNYKIIKIGDEAYQYVKTRIGVNSVLATLLEKQIDFKKGTFFTFMPQNVTLEHPIDLDSGGVLKINESAIKYSKGMKMVPVPNTSDGLVDYIYNFLHKNKNNIALIEDFLAGPEDKDVNNPLGKVILAEDNVYRLLTSDSSKENILHMIKYCSSFPVAIGILAEYPNAETLLTQAVLGEQVITIAVNNIKSLYIEAFDHEGYIIWE